MNHQIHSSATTSMLMQEQQPQLKKTLGPLMLWGLGVGYVISGMYFGWNLYIWTEQLDKKRRQL